MNGERRPPEQKNTWTVEELGALWKYARLKDKARSIKKELLRRHTDRSFRAKLWERRRLADGTLTQRSHHD